METSLEDNNKIQLTQEQKERMKLMIGSRRSVSDLICVWISIINSHRNVLDKRTLAQIWRDTFGAEYVVLTDEVVRELNRSGEI